MALKILQLRNKLDIAHRSLDELVTKDAEFVTRAAELEARIPECRDAEAQAACDKEIEAYEADIAAHEEAKANLQREIEGLEAELEGMDEPVNEEKIEKVERKETKPMEIRESREYLHAWTESVKTGKMDEVRSLLTENAGEDGMIPVPTYVESKVKTLWDDNEFFSRVRKTYVKGNLKIMVEQASSDAVVHEEGTKAPDEEELTIAPVTLVPGTIKKWISVSDEALSLTDEAFVDYIFDELTYRIIKEFESAAMFNIATAVAGSTVTASSYAEGILTAIGEMPGDARDIVFICSRDVWAAAKAEVLNAGYGYDPFAGLDVVLVSGTDFACVGDLTYGYHANFPNGQTVEVVTDARPKEDLVDFVGKLLVGHGVVAPTFRMIAIEKDGGDGE